MLLSLQQVACCTLHAFCAWLTLFTLILATLTAKPGEAAPIQPFVLTTTLETTADRNANALAIMNLTPPPPAVATIKAASVKPIRTEKPTLVLPPKATSAVAGKEEDKGEKPASAGLEVLTQLVLILVGGCVAISSCCAVSCCSAACLCRQKPLQCQRNLDNTACASCCLRFGVSDSTKRSGHKYGERAASVRVSVESVNLDSGVLGVRPDTLQQTPV